MIYPTLLMTVTAGAVAVNVSHEGLLLTFLLPDDEKAPSSKKHTQFKIRVLKPYPIQDQNGQNRYPIYDQND